MITIKKPPGLIKGEVYIHSLNGAILYSNKINDPIASFDISLIDKGIYIIEICDESGRIRHRGKLVKL